MLIILYYAAKYLNLFHMEHDVKKSAWFLSWIMSVILSIISLPILFRMVQMSSEDLVYFIMGETFLSVTLSFGFIMYCISDMICGFFSYKKEFRMLEGWIHHIFYIVSLLIFLYLKMSNAFMAFIWCEIPTAILSTGILLPSLRNNILYCATFYLFRIFGFAYFAIRFYLHCDAIILYCSFIPTLLIFVSHLYWGSKLKDSCYREKGIVHQSRSKDHFIKELL